MKLLFNINTLGGEPDGRIFVRPSARCIAVRDGRVAMIYSRKYNYYKFPGGGIEPDESREDALVRETAEEAGLVIKPDTVRELGYVHRVQKSWRPTEDYFVQDNYYYLCEVEDEIVPQSLCGYESDEGFALEWVEPDHAIEVNRTADHGPKDKNMIERETRVLEIIKLPKA